MTSALIRGSRAIKLGHVIALLVLLQALAYASAFYSYAVLHVAANNTALLLIKSPFGHDEYEHLLHYNVSKCSLVTGGCLSARYNYSYFPKEIPIVIGCPDNPPCELRATCIHEDGAADETLRLSMEKHLCDENCLEQYSKASTVTPFDHVQEAQTNAQVLQMTSEVRGLLRGQIVFEMPYCRGHVNVLQLTYYVSEGRSKGGWGTIVMDLSHDSVTKRVLVDDFPWESTMLFTGRAKCGPTKTADTVGESPHVVGKLRMS
ncbi:hypothetical protein BIW11_07791 [Tropilaelaps mercedesae]|uniref:Uncharacterized protein n=1 Tax=Tropilaelaps mercedesae TaxID=418985 RepID=A0A1V9XSL0_9ACAR|nr:hypothetical protein BIW11_07791 [Tropilaelaps mercedesae]